MTIPESPAAEPHYNVVIVKSPGGDAAPQLQTAEGDAAPVAAFMRRYADQIDPPKSVRPTVRRDATSFQRGVATMDSDGSVHLGPVPDGSEREGEQ